MVRSSGLLSLAHAFRVIKPELRGLWSIQSESNRTLEGLEGPGLNPSVWTRTWSHLDESNARHPTYKDGALPAELKWRINRPPRV